MYFSELKAGITVRDSEGNELGKSKVHTYTLWICSKLHDCVLGTRTAKQACTYVAIIANANKNM